MGYVTMSRVQAAALLGVTVDADSEQVRRAWRAWARLAHPDHGGDREFFDRLRIARDVLLDSDARPDSDALLDTAAHVPASWQPDTPPARLPWSQVLCRPRFAVCAVLVLLAAVAIGLAALVTVTGPSAEPLALALAAGPAAVAAAGWAQIVVSRILNDRADVAHRITALVFAWLPITAAQVTLAEILGSSLVSVLPVLVLPLVVVVAAVNPGAGLWSSTKRRGSAAG